MQHSLVDMKLQLKKLCLSFKYLLPSAKLSLCYWIVHISITLCSNRFLWIFLNVHIFLFFFRSRKEGRELCVDLWRNMDREKDPRQRSVLEPRKDEEDDLWDDLQCELLVDRCQLECERRLDPDRLQEKSGFLLGDDEVILERRFSSAEGIRFGNRFRLPNFFMSRMLPSSSTHWVKTRSSCSAPPSPLCHGKVIIYGPAKSSTSSPFHSTNQNLK